MTEFGLKVFTRWLCLSGMVTTIALAQCPPNPPAALTLSNGVCVASSYTSGIYQFGAINSISTSGTLSVGGSAYVRFLAGSSVTLSPGFHATAGSAAITFQAVVGPVLRITTATGLPNGAVNAAYTSTQVSATGTSGPYAWTVFSGALPSGLTLGASTGIISGTPTAGGTFSSTVRVSDTAGNTAFQLFTVNILGVGTSTLPGGTTGQTYGPVSLSAVGGTGPFQWSVTGLPAGLQANTNGEISGMPTAAGTFNSVGVTLTDNGTGFTTSRTLSLVVGSSLPVILTSALPPATAGQNYGPVQFSATGGTGAGYAWSASGLPTGLSISAGGNLTGTPATSTGSPFSIVFTVTDSSSASISRTLTLTVNSATNGSCGAVGCTEYIRLGTDLVAIETSGVFSITTPSLPFGIAGTAYTPQQLAASGGGTPYTWSIISGASSLTSLGLAMSSAGVISGTPTAAGLASFTVQATESGGGTATRTLTFAVYTTPFFVGPYLLQTAVGYPYVSQGSFPGNGYPVIASGGSGQYTFNSTGLPSGMSLSTGGTVSGTPATANIYTVNLGVTDIVTSRTGSVQTSLNVFPMYASFGINSNYHSTDSFTIEAGAGAGFVSFDLCGIFNGGTPACSSNWGQVNGYGGWAQTGYFNSGVVGNWEEWIVIHNPNGSTTQSNHRTFTVVP